MAKQTKQESDETKVQNGYSGYRYLNLNGQVVRRRVYVFDTIAFVMPDESPNARRRYSRDSALIVRSKLVHRTQAEATKGEFVTAYIVKGDGANATYKKVQVKGTGTFRDGTYSLVQSDGSSRRVYGSLYGTEQEAIEAIVADAENDLKNIISSMKRYKGDTAKLEKFLKKHNRKKSRRRR